MLQASPLLESMKVNEIIDPRLENNYTEKEVECMMHAVSMCTLPHPEHRPKMSKVFFFSLSLQYPSFSVLLIFYTTLSFSLPIYFFSVIIWTIQVLKILEGDFLSDTVYNSRNLSSLCITQNIDNGLATNQRNMKRTTDYNSFSNLLHSRDVMKLSTPRMSMHKESEQSSKLKPMASKQKKMENSRWSYNQDGHDVSEEYQAYLHGSLAKFVQNLNGKWKQKFKEHEFSAA